MWRVQKAGMLKVTRKASLLAAATQLPGSFEGLKEGMLSPGYVASVTGDSVFVRFLGSLTGRAGMCGLPALALSLLLRTCLLHIHRQLKSTLFERRLP